MSSYCEGLDDRALDIITGLEEDLARSRSEIGSLSRRLAIRFEETQAAYAVIRRLVTGWTPDGSSWWRSPDTTQDSITDAEQEALRAAQDEVRRRRPSLRR